MTVVKLQDGMFVIFYAVTEDYVLLSSKLLNKVFDFKINQKLCFLLINYNDNEPDFWWRAEPI